MKKEIIISEKEIERLVNEELHRTIKKKVEILVDKYMEENISNPLTNYQDFKRAIEQSLENILIEQNGENLDKAIKKYIDNLEHNEKLRDSLAQVIGEVLLCNISSDY